MAKVICFDIDGVLTLEADTDHQDLAGTYATRNVNPEAKRLINQAVDSGWTVTLYTGRKEGVRKLTENWLFANGIEYHFLFMDKPYFTYFVDDRCRSLEEIDNIVNGGKTSP